MNANQVTESDREFAAVLDDLGAEAVRDGQYEDAGYFFDAADWHFPPSKSVTDARLMLLNAALGRPESRP